MALLLNLELLLGVQYLVIANQGLEDRLHHTSFVLVVGVHVDVVLHAVLDHVPGQQVALLLRQLERVLLQHLLDLMHCDVLLLPGLLLLRR